MPEEKYLYRNIFVLINGVILEILTDESLNYELNRFHNSWHIKGYIIKNYDLIEKTVDIRIKDISALEITKEKESTVIGSSYEEDVEYLGSGG